MRIGAAPVIPGLLNAASAAPDAASATDYTKARLLDALLQSAPDFVYVLDAGARYVHVSSHGAAVLGFRPDEMVGKTWRELGLPAVVEQFEVALRAALLTGRTVTDEITLPADGPRDYEYTVTPVPATVASAADLAVVVARDVTDRRAAERALADRERHLRQLADAIPQVVWCATPDGQVDYFSRQLAEWTGTDPASAYGQGWADLVHPSDLPRVAERWAHSVATGAPYEVEARLRVRASAPDDPPNYRWILARATPIRDPATGALTKWVGTNTDIHAQKLAEERYRAREEHLRLAVRAADLGTWEIDYARGGQTHWSPRCREIFGFAPSEPITYDKILATVHPDDRDRMQRAGAAAGRDDIETEYRIVRRTDGQVRWIRSKGRLLVDSSGNRRRIGITMDVTDAKLAEEAVRLAKEQAESANHAKDRFLAVLSHELRTPLMPVLALAGSIESDAQLPDAVRDDARTIRRAAELEARLIDDLLDLTRIARGKISLDRQPVEVTALLAEAVQMLSPEADARRQTLEVDLRACPTPTWAHADPARLQQIFWNLIKNAIKFTPDGGTISITARLAPAASASDPSLLVSVSDTGIGIPPDRLPHLFDAFEQGDPSITRLFGGLGLGLAISKSLADLHHATLTVCSPGPNQGSTFTLNLPTIPAPHPSISPSPHPSHSPLPHSPLPHLSILLVEDHPDTRRTLTRLLRAKGYAVHAAGSVHEALETAERESLDLLISDLGLPDGTGHELMSLLAARHHLRGIALSGYGMDEDLDRSRAAGFLEHLTKPVDLRRLEQTIRRITAER